MTILIYGWTDGQNTVFSWVVLRVGLLSQNTNANCSFGLVKTPSAQFTYFSYVQASLLTKDVVFSLTVVRAVVCLMSLCLRNVVLVTLTWIQSFMTSNICTCCQKQLSFSRSQDEQILFRIFKSESLNMSFSVLYF